MIAQISFWDLPIEVSLGIGIGAFGMIETAFYRAGCKALRGSTKLTWTGSILSWECARSRFPNCEKRPLCLYG